jgi:phosphopantothenoylcysteine decarboxylase/phosphopantothenate--cysteine ligase
LASKNKPHVLITSGPTAVPIDEMRVITNRSTGEMGRLLANAFAQKNYTVTLLEGQGVTTPITLSKKIRLKKFFFYSELESMLKDELQKPCDVVVHAAAVSDFAMPKALKGKIASGKTLTLKLLPTKKIVNTIKKIAPKIFLVGFKLETKISKDFIIKETRGLFNDAKCDLVVANTTSHGKYAAHIIDASGVFSPRVDSKQDCVKVLSARIDKITL